MSYLPSQLPPSVFKLGRKSGFLISTTVNSVLILFVLRLIFFNLKMNGKSKSKQSGPRRRQRRGAAQDLVPHPPPFQAAFVVGKVLRFKASSALSGLAITQTNLLDLLCMADTTTTAQRLMSSALLRKVEIWGPMASDLSPVTVSVEFPTDAANAIGASNALKSDTSMGATRCAYVGFKPRPGSVASFWAARASSASILKLTGPTGSIVDVHLTYVLQNGESAQAVANALVAATVGVVYCRGLDGVAAATTVLPPLSYTTA